MHNRLRILIVFLAVNLALLLFFIRAEAGGKYLPEKTSGIAVSGMHEKNSDLSGYGITADYCLAGLVDLGISVILYTEENWFNSRTDLNSSAYSPFIEVHLLKNEDKFPVAFSIGGSFRLKSYSGSYLDASDLDVTSAGYSIEASVYRCQAISSELYLTPQLGAGYSYNELKTKDISGNSWNEGDDIWVLAMGLAFMVEFPSENIFFIDSAYAINEDNRTFSISLGFVFPAIFG